MSFGNPLGLLALLAVPLILALHLFRRRLRERRVAGLFLWTGAAERAPAGRRRSRLQRTASLVAELLAAVVLALVLAEPRLGFPSGRAELVAVLDDSASMAARGTGSGSAADRVRERLAERIARLPAGAAITLIRSGERPELICGPAGRAADALAALASWRPASTGHDLAPALELAAEIGARSAERVLYCDREPGPVPGGFLIEAHGAAAANAALLSAQRGPGSAGREQVRCDVVCFGRTLRGRLEVVAADGRRLGQADVTLRSAAATQVDVECEASAGPVVSRLVVRDDALPLDDDCVLPPAKPRVVSFVDELAPAVAARAELARAAAALPSVELGAGGGGCRVRFGDAAGTLEPGQHELVVAPVGEERASWVGPYLVERRSPLCEGLTLDGVVWTAGRGRPPGEPLVFAGVDVLASAELVGDDSLRLFLNIDATRSTLVSSPDWPILLANVAAFARARMPGVAEAVVPVGGVLHFRGDPRGVELVLPSGARCAARGSGLATFDAREPGLARIERDGTTIAEVGIHFVDPSESDLTGRLAFERRVPDVDLPADAALGSGDDHSGYRLLALLLLAVIVFDWWVLRGRPAGGTA